MISFAITVKNEYDYIRELLNQLIPHCEKSGDEIVVLDDYSDDESTLALLRSYESAGLIRVYKHHLNNDFAGHKNYLNEQCNGDYIFQIDADETLHPNLLEYVSEVLGHNPHVDLFLVPRVNVVTGLTDEDAKMWGWEINDKGWNCFPDYQTRIFKNNVNIKWQGKVHERIVGNETVAPLPAEEEWSLYHIKTIERQRRQNEFYRRI